MPISTRVDGQQFLSRLRRAWRPYQSRERLRAYPGWMTTIRDQSQMNSRTKFMHRVGQLTGNYDITYEWQENGDCIVQGVICMQLNTEEN